jgi:hypothetical protein
LLPLVLALREECFLSFLLLLLLWRECFLSFLLPLVLLLLLLLEGLYL